MKTIFKRWLSLVLLSALLPSGGYSSDHDDGENDVKGRSLNLTDLYVFREDWQTTGASANNLIFIMNTNPRSVARQMYYFSTQARYEFHVSRVSDNTIRPTGSDDVIIRFHDFSEPIGGPEPLDTRQSFKMTVIRDGIESSSATLLFTTTLTNSTAGTVTTNAVVIDGHSYSVFAGLREDPFFFDVECYFRVRNAALGLPSGASTRKCFFLDGAGATAASTAADFTAGYNVNSIVVRVPKAALQSGALEETFDVWETISIPQ